MIFSLFIGGAYKESSIWKGSPESRIRYPDIAAFPRFFGRITIKRLKTRLEKCNAGKTPKVRLLRCKPGGSFMAKRRPPFKAGDEVVLEIENYASQGEGVAKVPGRRSESQLIWLRKLTPVLTCLTEESSSLHLSAQSPAAPSTLTVADANCFIKATRDSLP